MHEHARLVGASTPFHLNGKTYQMSPLSDKDIAELDLWVQKQYMNTVYETAPADPVAREMHIRIGLDSAATLTWMSGKGKAILTTVAGMTRLLWQTLHKQHPDLKLEDLSADIADPNNLARFNQTFDEVNNQGKLSPGPQKKNRRKKR